jgi:dethiobiotin synthetase
MTIFIAGTGTDVGKTVVSSWLCLHTGASYWKPIQTGAVLGKDADQVKRLSSARIYPETYLFQEPLSPHIAALHEGFEIHLQHMQLPTLAPLIVEGAGGVYVPLNRSSFMIDLIAHFQIPLILVANGLLGTINQSLLTLEALRSRNIKVLGFIISGSCPQETIESICSFGKIELLAHLPQFQEVSTQALLSIPLPQALRSCL